MKKFILTPIFALATLAIFPSCQDREDHLEDAAEDLQEAQEAPVE